MTKDIPNLTHQQVANAAQIWLSKPFSTMVVQELCDQSWAQFRFDVVSVTPNAHRVTIIECKVSRSDYLRGLAKLEVYKTFCHRLFVAAPRGLLKKSEIPEGVGLLEVYPGGGARCTKWTHFGAAGITDANYKRVLERMMQKLIVLRDTTKRGW